ncbi:MAG TPA: hypothetical protein VK133_03830 [Amoebophilaceae bacterium]|nr:hypothetical protein [Amoebophilaceae bacterium]
MPAGVTVTKGLMAHTNATCEGTYQTNMVRLFVSQAIEDFQNELLVKDF